MKSLRSLDRRIGYSLGALGMLLGMVAPAVVPAFASADELTSRSIQMSSSAVSAASVTYNVTFTPQTTTGDTYLTLLFCSDTPLVGESCSAPSGMSLSSASVGSPGTLDGSHRGANYVVLHASLTASSSITIPVSAITNPDGTDLTSGTFYARIETFDTQAHAEAASTATTTTGLADSGGIAMAVNDTIGVSAAVRETMTFCVYGAGAVDTAPGASCDDSAAGTANSSGSSVPASLTLGEGSPKALTTSAVSTGKDYAQISTNAAHGAVVYMKNSNSCGGLKLFGASGCDIAPATGGGSDFSAGSALFGVKLGSPASDGASGATGTVSSNAAYATYNMKTSGTASDSSGTSLPEDVTSTYGGYLFGTSEAPIADQNVPLTFGASVSNTTPAGLYSANIDLIAVGTY